MNNVIPRALDPQDLERLLTISIALLADFNINTNNIIQVLKQKGSNGDLAHIELFRENATPYINTLKTYLELMLESYNNAENHTTAH